VFKGRSSSWSYYMNIWNENKVESEFPVEGIIEYYPTIGSKLRIKVKDVDDGIK
jgi:hypothetical protein